MESIKTTMTIGKHEVEILETELEQRDLLFYAENPRVFTQLRSTGNDHPSQADIEKKMTSLDHVKRLRVNIEANGGLNDPIIVRGNEVLEGNSRLAAYRILAKTDPHRWSKIKCKVLPVDMSEALVQTLLGSIHLVGQTEWSPFEKAGYLYRMTQKSRRPIKALAQDFGIKVSEAELYVKVFNAMQDNEDMHPTHWSYYYELYKSKPILKMAEANPSIDIIPQLCEKIKNEEFDDARELRKVATIAKVDTGEAFQTLITYLDDEISLNDAVEIVSEANVGQVISSGFDRFRKLLNNYDSQIRQQLKNDSDFILQMKQLLNTLTAYTKDK